MAKTKSAWFPMSVPRPKTGRYLVRAPSKDGKKFFIQVAWFEKMTKKELADVPEGFKHGFFVYPEQWTPFLTEWAFIPE